MKHLIDVKIFVVMICGICFAGTSICAPVTNKSANFKVQSAVSSNSGDSIMAEKIRAQRAALDARDAQDDVKTKLKSGSTKNACDSGLRKCIESKCGQNYTKCKTDTDVTFSDKLNACKKSVTCTAHEFTVLSTQFKEDKNQAITLSSYNDTIACGNAYNSCIIAECGPKFTKCLSKSAGDKAMAKCKSIATDCTEADSGMVGRVGTVFGVVRQAAETQIVADEKKLRSLREDMRASCKTLGALFDDRSLDCVFSVSFYADGDLETPKASKKLYAGSTFDCSPDWFGIDITTFKENAFRETRAQTAASSAMLGSGVGTAVGAITSGAINRAIDTKKAKEELKDACKDNNQVMDKKTGKCRDKTDEEKEKDAKKAERKCLKRAGKNAAEDALTSGITKTEVDGVGAAVEVGECLQWDDETGKFSGKSLVGKIAAKEFNKHGLGDTVKGAKDAAGATPADKPAPKGDDTKSGAQGTGASISAPSSQGGFGSGSMSKGGFGDGGKDGFSLGGSGGSNSSSK